MIRTRCFHYRDWVQSLVEEIRSRHIAWPKKTKLCQGPHGLTWLAPITLSDLTSCLHPVILLLYWSHSGFLSPPGLISQLKTYCCSPSPELSPPGSLDISFLHKRWDLVQCHLWIESPLPLSPPAHRAKTFPDFFTTHITEMANNDVPDTAQGTLHEHWVISHIQLSYYVIVPTLKWKNWGPERSVPFTRSHSLKLEELDSNEETLAPKPKLWVPTVFFLSLH